MSCSYDDESCGCDNDDKKRSRDGTRCITDYEKHKRRERHLKDKNHELERQIQLHKNTNEEYMARIIQLQNDVSRKDDIHMQQVTSLLAQIQDLKNDLGVKERI